MRYGHIAACLDYGGQHQRLLISGGLVDSHTYYDDLWLLDPRSGKVEEVSSALLKLYPYLPAIEI